MENVKNHLRLIFAVTLILAVGAIEIRNPARNIACKKLGGDLNLSGECVKISVIVIPIPDEAFK